MIKVIKNFFGKFKSEIKVKTDTVPPILKMKRYTRLQMVEMFPEMVEYHNKVIRSGEQSWMCGLPERNYTEIINDPKTGDRIIRYIES